MKLSVVLATYNEENNLTDCLKSVKEIADEIIIVDGTSSDKTVEIAKSFGAKVTVRENPSMFHINKQLALEKASHPWILQLDADERVSADLAKEIEKIIGMEQKELEDYQENLVQRKLFLRNQQQWENKQGKFGEENGEYVGFFIPRLNYFLGRYLRYGGVYPDGAIRLVRKDKAYFPCKDVHEIIQLEGKAGWLGNPLYHWDSPTFSRYITRNNRYIEQMVVHMKQEKLTKNLWQFTLHTFYLPLQWFFMTFILMKGFRDSWQGLIFSLFSALRFPRAYLKYISTI